MSQSTNSIAPLPNNSCAFLEDGTSFQFNISDLNSNTSKSVSVHDWLVSYGRMAYVASNTKLTGTFANFHDPALNSYNYGVGVMGSYWELASDKTSYPRPILDFISDSSRDEHDPNKIYTALENYSIRGIDSTFVNSISVTQGYFKDTVVVNTTTYLATHLITRLYCGATHTELKRQIVYFGGVIHYVSLVHYHFALYGTVTNNPTGSTTADNIFDPLASDMGAMNILVDFKYNTDGSLYGIDIINDNITNTSNPLIFSLNPSYNYTIRQNFVDPYSDAVIDIVKDLQPVNTGANPNNNIINVNYNLDQFNTLNLKHETYQPSITADINDFALSIASVSTDTLFLIIQYSNNRMGLYKYSLAAPSLISYEQLRYWAGGSTAMTLNFWSWSMFCTDNWVSDNTKTYYSNSMYDKSLINYIRFASKEIVKQFHFIQFDYTKKSLTITDNIATGVSTAVYNASIPALAVDPALASITYTQVAITTIHYNALYILTPTTLFMYIYSYTGTLASPVIQTQPLIIPYTSNAMSIYSPDILADHFYFVDNTNKAYASYNTGFIPFSNGIYISLVNGVQSYYISLKYITAEKASLARDSIKNDNWFVRHTNPTIKNNTVDLLPHTVWIDSDNVTVNVYINLDAYLSVASQTLATLNLYVFGIDQTLPYMLLVHGTVDARPLLLDPLTFTYTDQFGTHTKNIPILGSTASADVIHINSHDLSKYNFQIHSAGTTSNINGAPVIDFGLDATNWRNDPSKSFLLGKSINNIKFDTPIALGNFNASPTPGYDYVVRNPSPITGVYSITNKALTNSTTGPTFTAKNAAGFKYTWYLPIITVHDNHNFVVSDIYTSGVVDIDDATSGHFFAHANIGDFFLPPSGSDSYRMGFRFRCAPNYIDSTGNYTLYYENSNSITPIYKRLSTPLINKWWLMAIPQGTIFPGILHVEQILTERNSSISVRGNNNFGYNKGNGFIQNCYITDPSIDYVIKYIGDASIVSPTVENKNCFWSSGDFSSTAPSGYLDFKDLTLTTGFGGVSTMNGCIPVGTYAIIFAVEDTLGDRTYIDLMYASSSDWTFGTGSFLPDPTKFNY